MNVSLVMVNAEGESREFPLQRFPTQIGRDQKCRLRIPLSSVSRFHCELDIDDDELIVRDTKSSNGTYVNGDRVNERELIPGDLVSIGPVVFVIRIDSHPQEIDAKDCYVAGAVSTIPQNDGVPAWEDRDGPTRMQQAPPSAPKQSKMEPFAETTDPEDSDFDFDIDLSDLDED